MNLFSKTLSMIPGASSLFKGGATPETASGGAGVAIKTPAQLQAFLNEWSGDGTSELRDAYRLSPWVSSAIKHISRPIAQVGLDFHEWTAKGKAPVNDARLAFWNRPAKGASRKDKLSRFDTIEATVGWLCLKGEFFWVLDDTWLTRGPVKNPFIIARPDAMQPILDDGELMGWRFRDGNRREHLLIPDQVISSRFWNPNDPLRGAAPADAAEMAAKADYAAGRFWKSLAESNGDRGMTVIAPNGITPEQQEQIKMVLRKKRDKAKQGKYEPLFLIGDIKTEEPRIQSPDAAAVTQRLQNRHEVYIAFGVPPSFAEVTASYSIGSASDRFKLIEETCMPIAAKIAEAIETITERLIGRSVSACFNFEEHSTMQQVRAERMESARKMHERGIPWSVISDDLNLNLPNFPGRDKAWLPFNLQEVGGGSAPEEPAAPAKSGAVGALEELEELLRGCPAHPTPSTRDSLAKTASNMTKAAKSKLWEARMKTRAPYVKKVRSIVTRALWEARKETLANLATAEKAEKAIRSGAFDFIFDIGKFLELLVEPIFKVDAAAYEAAGAELLADDLGSEDVFISADPNGLEWLQARKNYIKDAAQDIWDQIRNSLDQGIQDGESYAKLQERVRGEFNSLSDERAMAIAVTETSIAFESGRHEAMVQAGAEWKEWLTSDDDRVRDTHQKLNGKVVRMDEPFLVGGAEMQYPCDPSGPAAEIIRCRCIHGPAQEPTEPDPFDIEGNNPSIPIPF